MEKHHQVGHRNELSCRHLVNVTPPLLLSPYNDTSGGDLIALFPSSGASRIVLSIWIESGRGSMIYTTGTECSPNSTFSRFRERHPATLCGPGHGAAAITHVCTLDYGR
jgi:hypothetical protein